MFSPEKLMPMLAMVAGPIGQLLKGIASSTAPAAAAGVAP
jgi:hypothetical protein